MFPVFVNDGTQEMPDDDILYIVCKEGTYLKKKLGIMESITPVKSISVLQSVDMMATMHIKPIPGTIFAPVMDFFGKIYQEHRAEAIVLLFYNEEKRIYKVVPPSQEVSAAGVDYTRAMTIEGYVMVGDIHSHANFSAFHSSTDDADEKSFDGLHITIGNNGDAEVSISASIVSNGQRFIVQPEDYISGIDLTVDIDEVVEKSYSTTYVWDVNLKKLVPRKSNKTYKVKRFDKRFVSMVSKKYQKCPDAWLALVSKKQWPSYTSGYGGVYGSVYGGWNTQRFDSNAWKDHKTLVRNPSPQGKPPLVPATTKPITFPPHVQSTGAHEEIIDDDFNPCSVCPFKDRKIDWVLEQLTEANAHNPHETEKYLDEEGNPIEWYECDQCAQIFSTIDPMPLCPNCNVDDHLILLDADDLEFDASNEKTPVSDIDWYECKRCKNVFETTASSPECPKCKKNDSLVVLEPQGESTVDEPIANYQFKCKKCATETSVLNHGQCPFCGGDVMDIIDADALRMAAEEDETMETIPIPVPDENRIPIGTRRKQKRKPGVFASLFNIRNTKS